MYSSSLKGKNAWVTGSSRGIGRIVAEFLAECGANVAIAVKLDVTDYDDCKRAADEVFARYGHIDILVCCAGGTNVEGVRDKSILEFESGYFRGIMDMNLYPSVFCCREIVPEMMRRENGSVVLIGSIAGCGGWKTGGALAAYPLAKSAIHEYARCLAAHTRHSGVRVNCVIPGNINTPRTRAVYGGDRAVPLPGLSPLEHVGKPEDIASLVHFLCSEGGRYISGQCIRVDGGEQLSPC